MSARRYGIPSALLVAVALLVVFMLALSGCGCGSSSSSGVKDSVPPTAEENGTKAESEASFKFIVCGDPQNNYEVFNRILDAARGVDFLIVAGDLTGSGTESEFQAFVSALEDSGVKCYTVPGNHDVATSPVTGNYTRFMGKPRQSFSYKNAHFVLIDNSTQELGFYPEQREWVEEDLDTARKLGFEHIIAVAHVPPGYPYSAKASTAQIPGIDANAELAPVLEAGGADELFCGHIHNYRADSERGLPITITGGAGAPLMDIGGPAYYHYVLVEVDGDRLTKQVIRL
jgi:Icc-related predicted phosphoesterase